MDTRQVDPLVRVHAGDGRFRFLHALPGAEAELLAAATEAFGGMAWVASREQLIDERWLGPEPPKASIRRRIGDVILAACGAVAFLDPSEPSEAGLVAAHGSLTADEMLVPLLAGRGTG